MRILKARYGSGEEFLGSYDTSFAHGGVFIPTRLAVEVGEPVVVGVQIGRRTNPLLVRGAVVWRRRGKHSEKIRAGLGVEFLASERKKRDFLLGVARGTIIELPRRYARLPIEMPVRWRRSGDLEGTAGWLRDIGKGGAFLAAAAAGTERGAEVIVELGAPGAEQPIPVTARVAWVGSAADEPGFGVAWRARDAGGNRRIRELVRRIETATAAAC